MIRGISDSISFLSKLTYNRLLNIVLVTTSYYLSRLTRKPIMWGNPISISVEPTTSCNLRCPECPSGLRSFTRPTGMLNYNLYKNIIDDQYRHLIYLLLYFQGEPFLHPDFFKLVEYANQHKIYTATSTNAHYLTDETAKATVKSGLDRLIISIDGTTQETYEQYRVGGSLDKVIEGAKKIVFWKNKLKSKTPYLIFQFLVVKPNEHQIEEVEQVANEIGIDKVLFKTAQLYDFEKGNSLMPDNQKYSRYKKRKDGTFSLKHKLYNHCWKMWHSTVVTWDGKVVPCCFDKDAQHQLGDLNKISLGTLWKSDNYRIFRKHIFQKRSQIDICSNCSEGGKIWI